MPILTERAFDYFPISPDQTKRIGIRLGKLLQRGMIVCLDGDLGAGKTTLVQGMVAGWGSNDRVNSPTFKVLNEYQHPNGQLFFHADAYRLSKENLFDTALFDLDLILQQGVFVLEWAQNIQVHLPAEYIHIQMEYKGEERRRMTFTPHGKIYEHVLIKLQQNLFGGLG